MVNVESRLFNHHCDLPLHVQFHVSGNEILQVDIVPDISCQSKMTWEVIGEPDLDSMIDDWMCAYGEKKFCRMNLPLSLKHLHLPPYTSQVLLTLPTIQFGQTISYRELASLTGRPKAARAAGSACGRNPFLLIVPCHRILASGGGLGGFSAGLAIKRHLLAFEGISVLADAPARSNRY